MSNPVDYLDKNIKINDPVIFSIIDNEKPVFREGRVLEITEDKVHIKFYYLSMRVHFIWLEHDRVIRFNEVDAPKYLTLYERYEKAGLGF